MPEVVQTGHFGPYTNAVAPMEAAGRRHPQGEGGEPPAKAGPRREKRKPKVDVTRLTQLKKQFAYQYGTDIAWDTVNKLPIKISALRHTFGNDEVKLWMNSGDRWMVMPDEVVFDPAETCGPNCVNLFRGWGVVPQAGDTAPFHELMQHVMAADDEVVDYVLNWLAYMLQNPGAKMKTALILHGDEGAGKNLLFETMTEIHGHHGVIVGQRELESQWNDWMSSRTLIIGDEVVSRQEMRHHKGVLKALVTSQDVNISTKFLNLRKEVNHANLVFLSNETQPLVLDNTDRRYLVVWTAQRGPDELYSRFVAWRAAGGAAAIFDELLKRDLSEWKWYAPPPDTEAKRALIELGRLSPERFMHDWMHGRIAHLPFRTCSADQAFRLYRRWCGNEGERWPMSKPQFSRLCQRQASDRVQHKVCRLDDGTSMRMWIMGTRPPETTWSDYATEAVASFEGTMRNWIKRTSTFADGDEA